MAVMDKSDLLDPHANPDDKVPRLAHILPRRTRCKFMLVGWAIVYDSILVFYRSIMQSSQLQFIKRLQVKSGFY